MVALRSTSQVVSIFAIACCCFWGPAPSSAEPILAGTVTDAITRQPVGGAEISIEYSGQVIGSSTTDIDGRYSSPFTIPPLAPTLVTMIASVRGQNYEISKTNFQVRAGTPVEATHNISIFPLGVTICRSQTDHSVIVGHFLPPVGKDFSDLSARVARSLDFALNTRLQTVHLSGSLQPSFEPCDAANPKTPRLGGDFARALRADAFINGDIADGPSSFTVNTYVSDAYDLFSVPATVTNRSVDLSNPSGASMAGETHAAVLAAIAAGLAKKDDCITALTVLSVAEQLVEVVPQYMSSLRKACEARLPNRDLARASR
jgi:hypothetical protein